MFTCEFQVRDSIDTHYVESEHITDILAAMLHIANYYVSRVTIFNLSYYTPDRNITGTYTEMD